MKMDLKGKVALVTGGTRGIGAATSMMLAQAGATVAVNYLKNEKAAKAFVKKAASRRLPVFLVTGDVSDYLVADQVVHRVIERTGRIDILVNNAGAWEESPIDHPRIEESFDRAIDTNLKSVVNMVSHCLPYLKAKSGRIINIAGTSAIKGEARFSPYASAKGGMLSLTKSLALELAAHHILVNAVTPGWTWTDLTTPVLKKPARRKEVLRNIPLGKVAQPEDIAGAVLFLASTYASHITGENIKVNGGSFLGD